MALRHYVTSVNIKKLSRLLDYITCEDAAGDGSYSFLTTAGIIQFIVIQRGLCL